MESRGWGRGGALALSRPARDIGRKEKETVMNTTFVMSLTLGLAVLAANTRPIGREDRAYVGRSEEGRCRR